jgi:hypothetical protein
LFHCSAASDWVSTSVLKGDGDDDDDDDEEEEEGTLYQTASSFAAGFRATVCFSSVRRRLLRRVVTTLFDSNDADIAYRPFLFLAGGSLVDFIFLRRQVTVSAMIIGHCSQLTN